MADPQQAAATSKSGLQLLSSKFIYALVALVALVGGLVYRMGWFTKMPSASAVSTAATTISTITKNTPILRQKVPDVFDGQIPPHTVESTAQIAATIDRGTTASEAAASEPTSASATVSEGASGAAKVIGQPEAQPLTSIKLNTGTPEITLDAPTISEATLPVANTEKLPNIAINI
jgi:hypothetical protein